MKIDTLAPSQYVRGDTYGLRKSLKLHSTANIVGDFDCGENCRIDGNVTITGRVRLGRNVHIATGARLFGSGNQIVIGDHTGVGPGSTLLTAMDDPASDRISLHAENELERARISGEIIIEDYVLIGAHCVILPNTEIRDEVILGAISLVRCGKILFPGRIYAGIPCVEIRNRPKLRYTK